jgi:hypothetical protein
MDKPHMNLMQQVTRDITEKQKKHTRPIRNPLMDRKKFYQVKHTNSAMRYDDLNYPTQRNLDAWRYSTKQPRSRNVKHKAKIYVMKVSYGDRVEEVPTSVPPKPKPIDDQTTPNTRERLQTQHNSYMTYRQETTNLRQRCQTRKLKRLQVIEGKRGKTPGKLTKKHLVPSVGRTAYKPKYTFDRSTSRWIIEFLPTSVPNRKKNFASLRAKQKLDTNTNEVAWRRAMQTVSARYREHNQKVIQAYLDRENPHDPQKISEKSLILLPGYKRFYLALPQVRNEVVAQAIKYGYTIRSPKYEEVTLSASRGKELRRKKVKKRTPIKSQVEMLARV